MFSLKRMLKTSLYVLLLATSFVLGFTTTATRDSKLMRGLSLSGTPNVYADVPGSAGSGDGCAGCAGCAGSGDSGNDGSDGDGGSGGSGGSDGSGGDGSGDGSGGDGSSDGSGE